MPATLVFDATAAGRSQMLAIEADDAPPFSIASEALLLGYREAMRAGPTARHSRLFHLSRARCSGQLLRWASPPIIFKRDWRYMRSLLILMTMASAARCVACRSLSGGALLRYAATGVGGTPTNLLTAKSSNSFASGYRSRNFLASSGRRKAGGHAARYDLLGRSARLRFESIDKTVAAILLRAFMMARDSY